MTTIDHEKQVESRIYSQYRSKPKLVQWLKITASLANKIEAAYQSILESYNIETAGTDELDVLGRIVVIDRVTGTFISSNAYLFGGLNVQFGSAQFRDGIGVENKKLNNDIFRLLIKAKIAKNTSDATLDGIIQAVSFIISTSNIKIVDPEDMSFYFIFDNLTYLETIVITNPDFDIIPKPQGVRYSGYIDLSKVTEFGYAQFGRSQFAYKHEA